MGRRLLLDRKPQVHPEAFVAPGAVLLGDVRVEADASIWFNCVLRGDVNHIRIGQRTNIQDLTLCHGLYESNPVIVGNDVTVGHCAIIHACVIEDECLIGMGARVLSGAVVGTRSIVAAGAVVREGQNIPPRSLVVGIPARVKRQLTDDEVAMILTYRDNYSGYTETYKGLGDEVAGLLYR